jgi:hypothetical protein
LDGCASTTQLLSQLLQRRLFQLRAQLPRRTSEGLAERVGHMAVAVEADIAGERGQVVFALSEAIERIAYAMP